MARTICRDFLATCAKRPQDTAVLHRRGGRAAATWTTVSWQEYLKSVERVAAGLVESGVGRGDRVAIWSNTCWEWAVADMAILGVGAVTVPIYHNSLAEDAAFILNDSGSVVLFCEDAATVERWRGLRHECPGVRMVVRMDRWDELLTAGDRRLREQPDLYKRSVEILEDSDLATLVYTSGTTGQPKGVVLTHGQVMSGFGEAFKLELYPTDTSLTFLPFAHIAGRMELWGHVHVGFCMGYAESIERLRENFQDVRPTFIAAVPRVFEKIYEAAIAKAQANPLRYRIFQWAVAVGYAVSDARVAKQPLPWGVRMQYGIAKRLVYDRLAKALGGRMRFAFSGGAPLSADIIRFFHAADVMILEGYGLTETRAAIFMNATQIFRFGTVGIAVEDAEVRIAEDGEIFVKSKQVMKEYYNNPEATRAVLSADGWLATGDIGELSADGFLTITDRKKDLIKTAGGKYVAPQKIENMLKLSKYVSNVLVHGDRKRHIVALIAPNVEELRAFAAAQGLRGKSDAELVTDSRVRQLFGGAVADVNKKLAGYESIKNFDVLPRDFTIEAGELTPSMKIKRAFCDQKYATLIARLYDLPPGLAVASSQETS